MTDKAGDDSYGIGNLIYQHEGKRYINEEDLMAFLQKLARQVGEAGTKAEAQKVLYSVYEINALKDKLAQAARALEAQKAADAAARAQNAELEAALAELKALENKTADEKRALESQLLEGDDAASVLRRELQQLRADHELLRADKEELEERLKEALEAEAKADAERAKAAEERAALAAREAEIAALIESRDEEIAGLVSRRDELQGRVRELEDQLEVLPGDDPRKLRARIKDLEEKLKRLQRDLTFATLVRKPKPGRTLERVGRLRECLEEMADDDPRRAAVARECRILSRDAGDQAGAYQELVDQMNDRQANIDVIVSLVGMAMRDGFAERSLKSVEALVGEASDYSE
jgi:chromosome segregation ATPase